MGDQCAFFYGTLMVPQILYRVCYGTSYPTSFQASLLTISPAILPAYTRHRVRYSDYPAIVPSSPDSTVRGTYVRGLTDGDLWRLDTFEGPQYARRKVTVRLLSEAAEDSGDDQGTEGGEEFEAETYVWIEKKEGLEEGEWDFADFTKNKLGMWIGGNKWNEDVDTAVTTEGQDHTGGRGPKGSITKQLDDANVEELLKSAV